MKLTIREIIHANIAITNIVNSKMKIKFQTAYNLLEIKKELEAIEEYVSKRMEMVGLFSEGDSENKKNIEEEIFNSSVDVNITPIKTDDLFNDENLSISLDDMGYIKPILS